MEDVSFDTVCDWDFETMSMMRLTLIFHCAHFRELPCSRSLPTSVSGCCWGWLFGIPCDGGWLRGAGVLLLSCVVVVIAV